jgi:hypothetical protein
MIRARRNNLPLFQLFIHQCCLLAKILHRIRTDRQMQRWIGACRQLHDHARQLHRIARLVAGDQAN